MPSHSTSSSSSSPTPDLNQLVMTHQGLHNELVNMTDDQAQQTHTGQQAETRVFTPPGKGLSFVLVKPLPSMPQGGASVEVGDTARNDSLLLTGMGADWRHLTYEKQQWPRIEPELKSYLSKHWGGRAAVSAFNQLAACHADLHDSLYDMVYSLAQTRHIQATSENYEYDPPNGLLKYTLAVNPTTQSKAIMALDKATDHMLLFSSSLGPDVMSLTYSSTRWPDVDKALKATLPGVRVGHALSRRFP